MKTVLSVLALLVIIKTADAVTASSIVSSARSYIGSTRWSYASSHETGRNTNKCNIFVANVLNGIGADVPNRVPFRYGPIGAGEWGKKYSVYLGADPCWRLCSGGISSGDVISDGVHMGIVTGNRLTTSATSTSVVENDWGFRSGQSPTCWRYEYNGRSC